jgi:hypothetical protein
VSEVVGVQLNVKELVEPIETVDSVEVVGLTVVIRDLTVDPAFFVFPDMVKLDLEPAMNNKLKGSAGSKYGGDGHEVHNATTSKIISKYVETPAESVILN